MKTSLLRTLSSLLAGALALPAAATPIDFDWLVDTRTFAERRTKLAEIPVQRFVPQAGPAGVALERRYLLTGQGLLSPVADVPVPATTRIPESAYGKLLIPATEWQAYGRLGPRALANFERVNALEPIVIENQVHYEVRVAQGANGNLGTVPNLATRAEVRPGAPVIGGFVIEGAPRAVLVRGIGPGLTQFGVGNALSAVRLQLFRYNVPIGTNEDWAVNPSYATMVAQAAARAGAFPLTPGVKDAAISIILAPGTYTVHAGTPGAAGGAVLLEVYLLD